MPMFINVCSWFNCILSNHQKPAAMQCNRHGLGSARTWHGAETYEERQSWVYLQCNNAGAIAFICQRLKTLGMNR